MALLEIYLKITIARIKWGILSSEEQLLCIPKIYQSGVNKLIQVYDNKEHHLPSVQCRNNGT